KAHRGGRGVGLARALLGRAVARLLAARQVDHPGGMTLLGEPDQRAAAEQLDVVGVGPEREDIDAAIDAVIAPVVGHASARSVTQVATSAGSIAASTRCAISRSPARAANPASASTRSWGAPSGASSARSRRTASTSAASWYSAARSTLPASLPIARST